MNIVGLAHEYEDQAVACGHPAIDDLAMDPRTMVKHGVPGLVRGALLSVMSARTQFARDGADDPMANDLDHAMKFLLALREMVPE